MSAPTKLPSIQGEYVDPVTTPVQATLFEVDEYVDSHSEGINECRMERRHPFPLPKPGNASFSDIDEHGNFIAKYDCPRCGCAFRREVWTTERVGRESRFVFVSANTEYHRNKDGETYGIPPGAPRIAPAQVRSSVMTSAMKGQSPAAIREAILRVKARRDPQ